MTAERNMPDVVTGKPSELIAPDVSQKDTVDCVSEPILENESKKIEIDYAGDVSKENGASVGHGPRMPDGVTHGETNHVGDSDGEEESEHVDKTYPDQNVENDQDLNNEQNNGNESDQHGMENSHSKRQSEANKSTLYLGNLHPFVTDLVLQGVFAGIEGITELKVIKDRATGVSAGYGFARFINRECAQIAIEKVSGYSMFGQQMRVNWALQKDKQEELGFHHHIFVGDLSPEVTDEMLLAAFSICTGCSDARVMWDHATGRSRGYGFVSFQSKEEAEEAIKRMDGAHVGTRCIRCGWAQHKTEAALPPDPDLLDKSDPTNTNVYVGNLPSNISDVDLKKFFGQFGTVSEMKIYRKGNYGFVRYRTHAEAVQAIVGMNSELLNGRKLKCSWGRHPKDPPSGVKANLVMAAVAAGVPQQAVGGIGMMPQGPPVMPHPRGPPSLLNQVSNPQAMGQISGDPEHNLIQGITGMSLYGANQAALQMPQESGRHMLQPHQLDPSQVYGLPAGNQFPPDNYNMQPQYNLGNHYFQK